MMISTIATAVMAVVAVWSLIRTFKIERMNRKNAEDQQNLSLRQLQSFVFFYIDSRYQEVTKGLQDEANKRWYQQRFFDLCRDVFVLNKQGNLPKEVLHGLMEKWRHTKTTDLFLPYGKAMHKSMTKTSLLFLTMRFLGKLDFFKKLKSLASC